MRNPETDAGTLEGSGTGGPQLLSPQFWKSPLAVLFIALVTVGISRSMLFAVLPPVAREIGMSEILVGIMFSAAAGTFALTSVWWGRLADRIGRVAVIAIGLAGFGVFMGLFTIALAMGLNMAMPLWLIFLLLFVPRVASAAASAGVFPGAQAYVADETTSGDRTAGTSLVASAMGAGLIAGPGLAGLMTGFGLLTPMYMAAVLGIAGGALAWKFLPETRKPLPHHADEAAPREKLRMRDPRILALLPLSAAISMMVAVTQQTSAFYFQDILGLGPAETTQVAGTALMMMAGATIFVQTAIVQRYRLPPTVLVRGGLALGLAAYALLFFAEAFWSLSLGLCLVGIAFGMANPGIAAAISLRVAPNEQGAAAGINASMSATGFMAGSLVGPGGYTLWHELPHIFGLGALVVILIAALMIALPNPKEDGV